MSKKLSTVLALLIVASMVLTACGGAGGGGTIKVGLLSPLSGAVPTFGLSTQEGVQMAVKEWNAKGGILGKQIELIVADSQRQWPGTGHTDFRPGFAALKALG